MKNFNSYAEKNNGSRERLSWMLIALGALSILTAKVIFLARFGEFAANPLAGLGRLMTWGEIGFLLFPYLGLAYFRLYAAETVWNRRLASLLALIFLASGLIMSSALMDKGLQVNFDFYFHSLICLVLQSALTLMVVGGICWGGTEREWRPAEFLVLVPLLASAVMLMSNVSMMWTRQLTGPALFAPYAFLALDLPRRLIVSAIASKSKLVEPIEESLVILRTRPVTMSFTKPSIVELLPGQAIFAQTISQQLPRQAQSGGGLF